MDLKEEKITKAFFVIRPMAKRG